MTQGQGELVVHRCPRCGGRMQKPAGSTLYWHADNTHPRCDITNIVDTTLEAQTSVETETPPEAPGSSDLSGSPKQPRRKK
jgi:ssDNA-binding Zn-finger/Zn-ribbon topoisomerase 1